MHLDWVALGQAAAVSIGVASAVVVIFSLGILALYHHATDIDPGNTS